jgi:hypothetical protein
LVACRDSCSLFDGEKHGVCVAVVSDDVGLSPVEKFPDLIWQVIPVSVSSEDLESELHLSELY